MPDLIYAVQKILFYETRGKKKMSQLVTRSKELAKAVN